MLRGEGTRVTVYEQLPLRDLPPQIMLRGKDRLGLVMTVGDIAVELFEQMYRRMDETEKHYTAWDSVDTRPTAARAIELAHLAGFGYIANRPAAFAYVARLHPMLNVFNSHFWFGRGITGEHAMRIIRGFMEELPAGCYLLAEIPGPFRLAREFVVRAGFGFLCSVPRGAWLAHKKRVCSLECYGWQKKG